MAATGASQTIKDWPEESREAAKLVIDRYGEPSELTETQLTWYRTGPWKRIVAFKTFYNHNYPIPHIDSISLTAAWWSSAPPVRCPLVVMMSRRTSWR
ncbi:MAG: hypothetical protein L0H63_11200 [Nitrococcus sp.]|nr:hypothetical protein [Nitrococcus sp.]